LNSNYGIEFIISLNSFDLLQISEVLNYLNLIQIKQRKNNKENCSLWATTHCWLGLAQSRWAGQSGFKAHLASRAVTANVRHGSAGDGSAAPAMPVVRCGGVRARACQRGAELVLGLRDGRGSSRGLTHGGSESTEGDQWCWLRRGVNAASD
jgi:hypothetical protein